MTRWSGVAISIDPGARRSDRRTPSDPLPIPDSLSRYDLTLLVIPLAFLCALVVGTALPVPTSASLVAASLCGAVVLTDALFLNPPTGR